MQTTEETVIIQKTVELCQTIIEQPEFQGIRRRIDSFMTNDEAKTLYQTVMEQGEMLQHKQQTGTPLEHTEITKFEANRESLVSNPITRGFLDAQQERHKIQESVQAYVAKTFELGRVPSAEDFDAGSCGPSCGCGH